MIQLDGFGQQISGQDYELYTDIIRNKSRESTAAIVVIKELVNEQESEIIASALKDNDLSTLTSLSHEFQFASASVNALNNYFSRDTSKISFEKKFSISAPVQLVTKSIFDNYLKKNVAKGWKRFYKNFPGSEGIFEFSRITYSNSKDRAVVYCAIRRNGLNGNGALLIFEKIGTEWKMKYKFNLWNN
ncbi:MAG: hypothetical protein ACRYFR_15385 [Janthinobacterium lividum]